MGPARRRERGQGDGAPGGCAAQGRRCARGRPVVACPLAAAERPLLVAESARPARWLRSPATCGTRVAIHVVLGTLLLVPLASSSCSSKPSRGSRRALSWLSRGSQRLGAADPFRARAAGMEPTCRSRLLGRAPGSFCSWSCSPCWPPACSGERARRRLAATHRVVLVVLLLVLARAVYSRSRIRTRSHGGGIVEDGLKISLVVVAGLIGLSVVEGLGGAIHSTSGSVASSGCPFAAAPVIAIPFTFAQTVTPACSLSYARAFASTGAASPWPSHWSRRRSSSRSTCPRPFPACSASVRRGSPQLRSSRRSSSVVTARES